MHQPTSDEPLVLVAGSGWDDHIQVGERTVPGDRNSNAGYPILSNEPVVAEDLDHEARFIAPPLLLEPLLASAGEDRIQRALQALFVATEATYVFLERNVVDAELGFCSQFTVRTRRIQPRRVLVHRSTPQGLKAESANFEIEVPKSETPGNAWGFLRSGGGI